MSRRVSYTHAHNHTHTHTPVASLFYKYMCNYLLTGEQLSDNGYPRPTSELGVASIDRGDATPPDIQPVRSNAKRHRCCRCQKQFIIYNDGKYQTVEGCIHHYGRLVKSKGEYKGDSSKCIGIVITCVICACHCRVWRGCGFKVYMLPGATRF